LNGAPVTLGLGIGWRPELALAISRRPDLGFVELVAENVPAAGPLPAAVRQLLDRGVRVVPHGISLSLGGADRPDPARLAHVASVARRCQSPLWSEHVAFVRAGGDLSTPHTEAGHLLPVPRTRSALDVVVENVRIAMDAVGLPMALENISALFEWPGAEMDEVQFLGELLDRTGALLLLDVSNVHANATNMGWDAGRFLTALPLDRLAYCHVGGGTEVDGVYHDTHADVVPPAAVDLLRQLAARVAVPGAMLERDDHFPPEAELNRELDAIRDAMRGPA
jgi:uncharacterized protein (UPF0276 family)